MSCAECGRQMPGLMVRLGEKIYCIICYKKIPFFEKQKALIKTASGGDPSIARHSNGGIEQGGGNDCQAKKLTTNA